MKNQTFGQKSKFRVKKSKLSPKIEIFVKNSNFSQKLKFWSKTEILVKNQNFGQKLKFWSKIEI